MPFQDGALWIVAANGVCRFDGEAWTAYTTADGLPSDHLSAIAVAPDGGVWVGILVRGVSRFDGATWTTYGPADGLTNNSVRAVAAAPDGALWFGTEGGASRYLPPDGR